jgi:hypothetical protein
LCLVEFCTLRFQPPCTTCFHVIITCQFVARKVILKSRKEVLGKRCKSLSVRYRLYGRCSKTVHLKHCKSHCWSATSLIIHCHNLTGIEVWTPFRHTFTIHQFFLINFD